MTPFTYRAKLLRVVDADTIDVMLDLGFHTYMQERIRLYDIDAPELSTEAGKSAKVFVEAWLHNDPEGEWPLLIDCRKYDPRGKYGRVLADVYTPPTETSLNDALRKVGYVKPGKLKDL